MKTKRMLPALVCCILLTGDVLACSVPVFRYALERWQADPYELVLFHKGPASDAVKAQAAKLQQQAAGTADLEPANVNVRMVDVTGEMTLRDKMLLQAVEVKDEPVACIAFPRGSNSGRVIWTGQIDDPVLMTLFRSPARKEIAKRIIDGHSAVWVLVESGNKAKDDAAYSNLQTTIARMEKELKLPLEDIQNDDKFIADTKVELKIKFSIIRIPQGDANETMFVNMLMSSEDDLYDFEGEPFAFAVFGRGRTYYALVGDGISDSQIAKTCQFITDACSCEVKEENPGIDLVMGVEWDKHITGSAIAEKPLPDLVGLTQLTKNQDNNPDNIEPPAPDNKTVAMNSASDNIASNNSTTPKAVSESYATNIVIMVGVLVGVVALIGFMLSRREA